MALGLDGGSTAWGQWGRSLGKWAAGRGCAPVGGAPQQIVAGHAVIGRGADQEIQPALPYALLVVGEQRLGDA